MKLYALLIGINDYPIKPLEQCIKDVSKIDSYLDEISHHFSGFEKKKLLNDSATKEAIVTAISGFLGKAGDDDIVLLYYSGHGAQEKTAGRFIDEHGGTLECLVPYYTKNQNDSYLLADKELRYLFSKLPNNPHIVTVFDSCHAGDIVRDGAANGKPSQVKRMSGYSQARKYEDFIFSEEITETDIKEKPLSELIPFKNSVHIAASEAGQLSWEDSEGGVFTRYLLELLKATNHQISYREIAQWANISLKDITQKKQNPTISIQGEGKITAYSPWLNLHDESTKRDLAYAIYNEHKGWYMNIGSIMGMKEGMSVTIDPQGKGVEVKVKEVEIDTSLLEDPLMQGIDLEHKRYEVSVDSTFSDLNVYINNIDGTSEDLSILTKIVEAQDNIFIKDLDEADFFINIFNEFVYISLPNTPFRPLAEQLSLLKDTSNLEDGLKLQLSYLVKWNHFNTLVNPSENFDHPPIKVEIQIDGETTWHDVTDAIYTLEARENRVPRPDLGNPWAQVYRLKITNISSQTLYVGILELGSNLGISANTTSGQVIKLQSKEEKLLFDQSGNEGSFVFDAYKEIYNWKDDWMHVKFIVNNYESFTTALSQYLQPSLSAPLTISRINPHDLSIPKQLILGNIFDAFTKRWSTYKTSIYLKNPEYNLITGDLLNLWEYYEKREELAPFIDKLYFQHQLNGFITRNESLPNKTGEDINHKSLSEFKVFIGNTLDNLRRKRKFRRRRRKMPDSPIIIAEGDSWFLYPFLVKDIIDYVMEDTYIMNTFPVLSIAAAGDELENYKEDGHLIKSVNELNPKYVLISGGGNDIIGPEIQHLLKEDIPKGRPPRDYMNEQFDKNMEKLRTLYKFFVSKLKENGAVKQLIIHGYDYIRVDHNDEFVKNGWVNKYMKHKGIEEDTDRDKVIKFLVDSFNEDLIQLSQDDPFVTYINLRTQVKEGQWYDEIHPDDDGNRTLGNIFIDTIKELQKRFP